jgi:hypothetical protein
LFIDVVTDVNERVVEVAPETFVQVPPLVPLSLCHCTVGVGVPPSVASNVVELPDVTDRDEGEMLTVGDVQAAETVTPRLIPADGWRVAPPCVLPAAVTSRLLVPVPEGVAANTNVRLPPDPE